MEVWTICVLISGIAITGLPDVQSKGSLAESKVFVENGKPLRKNKAAKIFDEKPKSCAKVNGILNITFVAHTFTGIDIVVLPGNITLTVDGANLHEDCRCEEGTITKKKLKLTGINFSCPLQTSTSLQLFGVKRLCDLKLHNKSGAGGKQIKCTEWNQMREDTTQKPGRSTEPPDPCSSGSFKCQNGTCSLVNNTPLCQCYDGSTGQHCDKTCDPGTFGANCSETCGEGCVNSTCDVKSGTCSCLRGWNGSRCEKACTPGTFGANCRHKCGEGCVNGTCGIKSGNCSCLRGWNGSRCEMTCDHGTFGVDCSKKCADGCVNGSCDVKNGTCSCLPGWKGSRCDTACDHGTFGVDCSKKCADGCVNGSCDVKNGTCSCLPGWKGSRCDTECPDATFGDNCTGRCSRGCSRPYCNKTDGSCVCRPGYKGSTCHDECKNGTYGHYCNANCSQGCSTTACDKINGSCSCKAGYTGPTCDERCKDGTYGHNCNANCSQGCSRAACDMINGSCSCKAGYTGPTCDEQCKNGTYGHYCNSSCSEGCSSECDKASGKCSCKPGYKGNKCVRQCKNGTYGHNCNANCSQGCSTTACDKVNGSCSCKPGYTGPTCDERCKDGTYGHNCNANCSQGCSRAACDMINGSCSCKAGYTGPTCDEQCKNGTYGHYCNSSCSEGCSSECDKASGKCSCKPGYKGNKCVRQCKNGTYGHNCNANCSQGCSTTACDKVNGSCSCKPGYTGPTCDERCKDGTYGHNCNANCSQGCSRAACDMINGSCSCKAGYTGPTCDEQCKNGTYGHYCNSSCSEGCSSECDKASGKCSCKPGYKGNKCVRQCQNGTYGHYCNAICSQGCSTTACDKINGSCICKDGYTGPTCDEQCKDGTYGHYCNTSCSEGCSSECNKANGKCSCKPGYKGNKCVWQCDEGYFGVNCKRSCSLGCVNSSCTGTDGGCNCRAGWKGHRCNEECANGTYGENCSLQCSHGCRYPCDGASGRCKCRLEWEGPKCLDKIPLRKTDFLGSELMFHVVAAFAILVIVVMVAAAILFLRDPIMRWRNGHAVNAGDVGPPRRQAGKDDTQETSLSTRSGPSPVKDDRKATTSGGEPSKKVSMRGRLTHFKEKRVTLKKSLMFENQSEDQMPGAKGDDKDNPEGTPTPRDEALFAENNICDSASRIAVKDFHTYLAQKKSQKTTFDKEYSEFPQGLSASHDVALSLGNNAKNRFKGIYPYDHSRVCLKTKTFKGGYINASYINGPSNKRQYIATQGPLPNTVADFWQMVWENQCPVIVMLANIIEDQKERCHQYWNDKGVCEFGDWSVTCLDICQLADLTIRTLSVQKNSVSKQVKHIHFTVWPDKGVPKYPMSLVTLRTIAREFCDFDKGPMVVHCSAGVGRTGTLIALDYLQQEAETQGSVDVYACVWKLRTQRLKMVQTKDQYVFLHDCVLEALEYTTPTVTTAEVGKVYKKKLEDTDGDDSLPARFKKLNSCPTPDANATVARYAENIQKNRRQSVYPDDSERPVLTTEVEGQTDYINAVFVSSYKKQRGFLLTQTPLASTAVDIWRLIHDYRVSGIVVLDNYTEDTSDDCAVYWAEADKPRQYGPFTVSFIRLQNHPGFRTELYKYTMKGTNESREITLFRADSWNSSDLPTSSVHFLTLLDYIRQWNPSTAPLLVQCRDGATRSGLFCVVSTVQEQILTSQRVSVDQAIRTTRSVRPQVIPTMEQYRFCHAIAMEYLSGPWKGI
ncbi:multiple epidermal growth factor-like domains protein 6 isoform X4 [Haliotis rubra]|uniref:multiple epidermal growth factor-like domains protein 6 isoform X4 n=1 Tax=Haliotis rubra TaxID=36100 RepID=UPI001EE5512C|nr:multiple epidermal growth factor-like domains protein 6 isoform X4 [Haliotis rubra]